MAKRTASPRQQETYRWRISRLKATPAQYIGEVEAPDEASAIKKAIEEFQITDRWKQIAARCPATGLSQAPPRNGQVQRFRCLRAPTTVL